jgi:hypothetical protein
MLARRAVAGAAAVGVIVIAVDADAREEVVGSVRSAIASCTQNALLQLCLLITLIACFNKVVPTIALLQHASARQGQHALQQQF